MAGKIVLGGVHWFEKSGWSKRNYFYTRNVSLLCHSNGASYLAIVGVNRQTWKWDGAIFKAPGDGTISVHCEFIEGQTPGFKQHSANVAIEEIKGGSLNGYLHVIYTQDEGGLFKPFTYVVEP